jgi:hypothetical protein
MVKVEDGLAVAFPFLLWDLSSLRFHLRNEATLTFFTIVEQKSQDLAWVVRSLSFARLRGARNCLARSTLGLRYCELRFCQPQVLSTQVLAMQVFSACIRLCRQSLPGKYWCACACAYLRTRAFRGSIGQAGLQA